MKVLKIIGLVLVLLIGALALVVYVSSTPLTKDQALEKIQDLLDKEVAKHDTVSSGLVKIRSRAYKVDETFVSGMEEGQDVKSDQQFHVASVGKAFTATLIGILIEEGQLKMDDKINQYLDHDLLEGLFVIDGQDYSHQITIKHLLSHTSGLADYYDDQTHDGRKITQDVVNYPNTRYTPESLLAFSRDQQKTFSKPGQYHYSDTGYILLGLIIEEVSSNSFGDMLVEHIFDPLQMHDTFLVFYTSPKSGRQSIADIWLNGTDVSAYESLSVDWSGGGIISTLDDLDIFVNALNAYDIISKETLESFYEFDHKFMQGLHYGNGFMEYHFGEYFPTLDVLPKFKGHMGTLGTHMLYDDKTDTTLIMSFGSSDYAAGSVQTMIKILGYLSRVK